jgi:DNA-directed RNA polymerase subunit omega
VKGHDTLVNPEIEGLLERADSKFKLVVLSSKRARQINAYFGQLGEGLGSTIPPQITSTARKPLSIAFEEMDADKIISVDVVEEEEPSEEELLAIAAMEAEAAEEDGEETADQDGDQSA